MTLENIVFHKGTGAAKLCNFGFYHLTVEGKAVEYFVGDMAFSAPEVISAGLRCNLWFISRINNKCESRTLTFIMFPGACGQGDVHEV